MEYRSAYARCAVSPEQLVREFGDQTRAKNLLLGRGFRFVASDVLEIARMLIGSASYCRGARLSLAPAVFDCSSFIKWIYGQIGIWVPRRSIQQYQFGRTVAPTTLQAGDLVFFSSYRDYYLDNLVSGIGHVALATGAGTVIHAVSKGRGVRETPFGSMDGERFRGVRRILPDQPMTVWTVIPPPDVEIETSDDILWVLRIAANKNPE